MIRDTLNEGPRGRFNKMDQSNFTRAIKLDSRFLDEDSKSIQANLR
jgi:hypothetical protein